MKTGVDRDLGFQMSFLNKTNQNTSEKLLIFRTVLRRIKNDCRKSYKAMDLKCPGDKAWKCPMACTGD